MLILFWNHMYDFRPSCTPHSAITIIYSPFVPQNIKRLTFFLTFFLADLPLEFAGSHLYIWVVRHCKSKVQDTTQCYCPRLQPRSLNPESSRLTVKPQWVHLTCKVLGKSVFWPKMVMRILQRQINIKKWLSTWTSCWQ